MKFNVKKVSNGFILETGERYDGTYQEFVFTSDKDLVLFLGKMCLGLFADDDTNVVSGSFDNR